MCVVPFILGESVVDSQEKFQAAGGVYGNAALIVNLDHRQLGASDSSNASYDLRVGHEYRGYRDEKKSELANNGKITLRPGDAIIIQTEEILHLPKTLFGYVVPKVSLLQKGITNTLSKVDPGYPGPLIVTLFNLGTTDQEIDRCDPFCALVLHRVSDGATLYNKGGKQVAGNVPGPPLTERVTTRLEKHKTLVGLGVTCPRILIHS